MCEPLQQPLKGHKRIGELADGGTMPVTSFPRRIIALMLLKCVIFVYDIIDLESLLVPQLSEKIKCNPLKMNSNFSQHLVNLTTHFRWR